MSSQMIINYRPIQSINMFSSYINYILPIGHPLYGIVWEFYQFNTSEMENYNMLCFPDACTDMLFFIDEQGVTSFVLGSFPKMSIHHMTEKPMVFGIRFVTGSFGFLCRIPAKEYLTKKIQVTDVLNDVDVFCEKLAYANNFAERVSQSVNLLLALLNDSYEVPLIVRYAVDCVMGSRGNIRVAQLCEEMGYSERYIRNLFDRHVGVSPKYLCEIVRFQSSVTRYIMNSKLSMDELAFGGGYYDLAHMIKSYKSLTGSSPSLLFSKMTKTAIHRK